jgi:CubicO group peptidase (beta-lactamase class C family)
VAQSTADSLTQALQILHRGSRLPGFAVAVVTKDSVCYQRGFGYADVRAQRPYTAQTIQNLGSVSKTVVGLALMQAVERGLFTLDTPINQLLPFPVVNPHHPDEPITVRHLATHTAGILDRPAAYRQSYQFHRPGASGADTLALGAFLRSYFQPGGRQYRASNFAATAPGRAYAYSNLGAALAAYIVEVQTHRSFAAYTRQHLLGPLGLVTAGWQYDADQAARTATNYKAGGRAYRPYSLVTYPDGGLHLSVAELSHYLQAVLAGYAGEPSALLSAAGFQTMLRPQFAVGSTPVGLPPREPNAGIFWVMRANGTIGHSGSDPGTTVFMFFSPTTGIGRILITNVDATKQTTPTLVAIWRALEAQGAALAGR